MLACGSPWLFAAYRVLRRQSVPWHPPCALIRLILPVHSRSFPPKTIERNEQPKIVCFVSSLCSFQGALKSQLASILQNDTEIIILSPVKSRRQLRWLTIIFGFSAALPVFPAPAADLSAVDLGYDLFFTDHFSLERR